MGFPCRVWKAREIPRRRFRVGWNCTSWAAKFYHTNSSEWSFTFHSNASWKSIVFYRRWNITCQPRVYQSKYFAHQNRPHSFTCISSHNTLRRGVSSGTLLVLVHHSWGVVSSYMLWASLVSLSIKCKMMNYLMQDDEPLLLSISTSCNIIHHDIPSNTRWYTYSW